MSLRIYVDAYSGYKVNELPRRFWLDARLEESGLKGAYEIEEVEDRWYEPDAIYFRVRTPEGKRYNLRLNKRADEWTLQSGFDGAELLAPAGTEVIMVDPATIRRAELKIASCEQCRTEEAELPFDWILADVMGKHGGFEFILSEPA